jgi:hypothetical protein
MVLFPLGIRKPAGNWWTGHNYNLIANIFGIETARIFNQVSAFLTMLVAFQRYVSVCLPHRVKQLCSVRLVNYVTAISYVFSLLFHLPNFFFFEIFPWKNGLLLAKNRELVTNQAFQIGYTTVANSLVTYIIPLVSVCFMCTRTLIVLNSQGMVVESQERSRARKDLTLSSVAIDILFIICQSLSSVQKILMWVYSPWVKNTRCLGRLEYFAQVPTVGMCFNSAANFLIYVIFAKGFRRKVKQLFTISKNKTAPDDLDHPGTVSKAKTSA